MDFNPRAREGRDAVSVYLMHTSLNFNPRAREGRDREMESCPLLRIAISIHAPVKGATQTAPPRHRRFGNFNPRAREGRDLTALNRIVTRRISIHAPVKGAT